MEIDEIKKVVERVKIVGVLADLVKVRVDEVTWELVVEMSVKDRISGELITTTIKPHVGRNQSEDDIFEMVKEFVHYVFAHELDECLMVDGVRRWDPHGFAPGA